MNPEVTKLLSELAAKMGTTIEYLWPKLVGHAQAEATVLFWGLTILGGLILLAALACFLWGLFGDGDEGSFFGAIIATLLCVLAGIGAASQYADKRFPEAAVIQKLLGK